ncbi:MAG: hypothetical protein IJF07_03075 [Lachnospiraceae bacterium]|nr:hypothetical protein [Lachnospiraceae bacterium]
MTKSNKKNRLVDTSVFVVLWLVVSITTLILFYHQTTGSPERFHSDMKAYILEMQGLDSGYSFPYPIFFKLSAFFHLFVSPELAVAIATMVLNSLAIVITKLSLNYYALEELEKALGKRGYLAGVVISVTTISLFFISMLFPPEGIYLPGIKHKYLGVFSANPFHNATYMAARPFAILAFLWYVKLLDCYEQGYRGRVRVSTAGADHSKGVTTGVALRDYILFSVFLLLSTMTKPSFTIVLVGAAGLIMLWRMFRSRFQNFVPTIQLGLCFVPTFIDLLYQYSGVFVPDEGMEGGMGFTLGEVWGLYCDNIPLAICLGVGFPLAVLVMNFKELKNNTLFRFSWQIYGMGFLMAFLLYEKGFRKPDFNFSWGYMYGIFFAFYGALFVLLRATAAKKKPIALIVQWLPLFWHIACGLYYFYGIYNGAMYY